jgi:hypothetical protein
MVSVSYVDHPAFAMTSLRRCLTNATLQPMYTVARFLQMVGLTIPILAIFAQLNQSITAGKMLGFLVASVLIFSIGYLLQRSIGGRS